MAKKRSRKGRRNHSTIIPIAVVAGLIPLALTAKRGWDNEGIVGAGKETLFAMSGYHYDTRQYHLDYMKNGLFPILGGVMVHWLASKLGVNRALGRARIPLLRI